MEDWELYLSEYGPIPGKCLELRRPKGAFLLYAWLQSMFILI